MASRKASYVLSIAFDQYGGAFFLDHSAIDGPDGLFNGNAYQFTGTYDDVTADVDDSVTVTLGTDTLVGAVQAGSLQCSLCNPTDPGKWNPNNPSSVLNTVVPGFTPMRPVSFVGTQDGTPYGVFFGFIRRATWNAITRACDLYCEDLLLWASRVFPVIASTGPTTTGAAIAAVLATLGWVDPAYLSLDAGDSIADFSADGSASALDLIAALLTSERGTVFVRGDGVVVYESRSKPLTRASSGTLHSALVDLDSGIDVDKILTRASVTKTGGVAQLAVNSTAENSYGRADISPIDTPYLPNDAAAAALAADLVYAAGTAAPPVVATLENEDAATLTLQLSKALQTVYDIQDDLGGTAGTYIVQRATHTVQAQGFYHETEYLMTKRAAAAWHLDGSTIDGPDAMRY